MKRIAKSHAGKLGTWALTAMFCAACVAGIGTFAAADTSTARSTARTPVSDLTWTKLPNGRLLATISGDRKTGPHITYVKFAPGMKTVPHTHSVDYVGVVVTGKARHFEPGKAETEIVLPPGSTWSVPANVVHVSECLQDAECIFSIHQHGPFDIKAAQ